MYARETRSVKRAETAESHVLKSCLILFAVALSFGRSAQAQPIAAEVFFTQDWCPVRSEVAELEAHFLVVRSRCCVYKVEPIDPNSPGARELLTKFSKYVVAAPDLGACYGDNAELAADRAQLVVDAAKAKRDADAMERAGMPSRLRQMRTSDLCLFVGQRYRDHEVEGGPVDQSVLPAIWNELKARSISIDFVRSIRREIVIGDGVCQLLASKGLPVDINRTVNKSGTRAQYVYPGRLYVYTENGVVTAYQD